MLKLAVVTKSPEAPAALLDTHPVLMIPGWNGSGPGHWQTIREREHPGFKPVEQANWTRPSRNEWLDRIDREVGSLDRPGFLVAHSLGCLAVAHWSAQAPAHQIGLIAGAFLVAPPWLTDTECCPSELADFLPMPLARLPFAAMLVASEDDHYLPIEVAARLAAAWQGEFVNVGRQGHINVASGHGHWPLGEGLLRGFVAQH